MLLSEIPNISNSNREKYNKFNITYNEYINSIPNLEYLLSELQDLYSINFILYMSKKNAEKLCQLLNDGIVEF